MLGFRSVSAGQALLVVLATVVLTAVQPATAKGSHASSQSAHSQTASHSGSKAVPGVKRDSHGKIARSPEQKAAFEKSHPCPSTGKSSGSCPGYVVDHVVPLKRGGADRPENMQWQTKEAAKAKDKTE
jgi:hypothetical protein